MGNQRPKFHFGMLLLVFLLAISSLQAQRIISGKVTDATSGEALIGANVLLTGSNIGTITDLDGLYRLEVPENLKKLVFHILVTQSKSLKSERLIRLTSHYVRANN